MRNLAQAVMLEALYRSDTVWKPGTPRAQVIDDIVCCEINRAIRLMQAISLMQTTIEHEAFKQSGAKLN
jgi:hypothetical protein